MAEEDIFSGGNSLKREFGKRIGQKEEEINITSPIFKMFVSLNVAGINNYDICFMLANEIICNRRAIMSLDRHVNRLYENISAINDEQKKDRDKKQNPVEIKKKDLAQQNNK